VTTPYDIEEHKHRFSVWAAARATQRGFTSVDNLRKALEKCGVRDFLTPSNVESVDKAGFEELHREWCKNIMACLEGAGGDVWTRRETHRHLSEIGYGDGRKHQSALARVAHPPIDSILLRGVAKAQKLPPQWAKARWTTLDENDYYRLVDRLRDTLGQDEPLWMLERFWTVTDGRNSNACKEV